MTDIGIPCYRLEGKEVVPCEYETWLNWFVHSDRRVELTDLADDVVVSTVFIGNGPAIFETMVFAAAYPRINHFQQRSNTWDDAVHTHNATVLVVKEVLKDVRVEEGAEGTGSHPDLGEEGA